MIFTALVVPPVSLVILALVALLVGGRWGRPIAIISLVALLTLAMPVVSQSLLASLAVAPSAGNVSAAPPAAIVVLGGDVDRLAEEPGAGTGALSLERVRAGAALQRRTGLPVLVTGGIVNGLPIPVGTLMARTMVADFAVPVRWTEDASLTTWDNAALSAPILKAAGIGHVYLVTHDWHMRRSVLAFAHFGIAAEPAPVRPGPRVAWTVANFMPGTGSWERSFWAIHEWTGLLYYALRR